MASSVQPSQAPYFLLLHVLIETVVLIPSSGAFGYTLTSGRVEAMGLTDLNSTTKKDVSILSDKPFARATQSLAYSILLKIWCYNLN